MKPPIEIEKLHKESATAQFEVVMHYDEVMKAVDNYHIVR